MAVPEINGLIAGPADFWESIFACIEVGGDTDTVAACCGVHARLHALPRLMLHRSGATSDCTK